MIYSIWEVMMVKFSQERIDRQTVRKALEDGAKGDGKTLCALLEALAYAPPTAEDWQAFALEVTEAWKGGELPVHAFRLCMQKLPGWTVLRLARTFERISDDDFLLASEDGLGGTGIQVLGAELNLLSAGVLSRVLFRTQDEGVFVLALEKFVTALAAEQVAIDIQVYIRKHIRRLFERWMRSERVIGLLARLAGKLYRDEEG